MGVQRSGCKTPGRRPERRSRGGDTLENPESNGFGIQEPVSLRRGEERVEPAPPKEGLASDSNLGVARRFWIK